MIVKATGVLSTLATLVHASPMHAGGIRIREVHDANQIGLIRGSLNGGESLGDPEVVWLLCMETKGNPVDPDMIVQETFFNAGVAAATATSYLALLGIQSRIVHASVRTDAYCGFSDEFGDEYIACVMGFGYEGDSL